MNSDSMNFRFCSNKDPQPSKLWALQVEYIFGGQRFERPVFHFDYDGRFVHEQRVPRAGRNLHAADTGFQIQDMSPALRSFLVVQYLRYSAFEQKHRFGGRCVAMNGDLRFGHHGVEHALGRVGVAVPQIEIHAPPFAPCRTGQKFVEKFVVYCHAFRFLYRLVKISEYRDVPISRVRLRIINSLPRLPIASHSFGFSCSRIIASVNSSVDSA